MKTANISENQVRERRRFNDAHASIIRYEAEMEGLRIKANVEHLNLLCIATGTTFQNFLSRIRQGWKDEESSCQGLSGDEIDLQEIDETSKDLSEVRGDIPAIQEIEAELSDVQKSLGKTRRSRKHIIDAQNEVSDKTELFDDLTNKRKGLEARIGSLERQRRLLRNSLTNFKPLDDRRGVEDIRTLRSFLNRKRMKQGKLDAMHQFFSDRLKAQNRNGWLQTYIDDFFPRAELRGKKKILVGYDPSQVPAANPEPHE